MPILQAAEKSSLAATNGAECNTVQLIPAGLACDSFFPQTAAEIPDCGVGRRGIGAEPPGETFVGYPAALHDAAPLPDRARQAHQETPERRQRSLLPQ